MHITSLELCKELYELSGWEGYDRWYMTGPDGRVIGTATPRIFKHDRDYAAGYRTTVPAYDLGYLLRKLPSIAIEAKFAQVLKLGEKRYMAWVANDEDGYDETEAIADTPEDAACKLCISLLKSGILLGSEKTRKESRTNEHG